MAAAPAVTKAPVGSLKLYHSTVAYHPAKAAMTLAETRIPHTTVKLDLLAGATLEPWFVKLNPAGSLPVIEHNGKVITESLVICHYLDGLLETPLGGDQVDRAFVDQFAQDIDKFDGNLWAYAHSPPQLLATLRGIDEWRKKKCAAHAKRHPELAATYQAKIASMSHSVDAAGVPEKVAECEAILAGLLDTAEGRLAAAPVPEQAFLAGPAYSLVDALFAPILYRVSSMGGYKTHIAPRAAVAAYLSRVQARRSWQEAFGEGASTGGKLRAFLPALLRSKIGTLLRWY